MTGAVSLANIVNPVGILNTVSVRDFRLTTRGEFTHTNTESFYVQDDWKASKNIQFNLGLRWDYQQTYGSDTKYFALNNFIDNAQPRLGFIWDFTGEGRGKIFANFAKFVETPIPLDLNVRAGGDQQQIDFNIRVNRLNAPAGSTTLTDFGNLGGDRTPIDPGLKPQTVNEWTAGIEYSPLQGLRARLPRHLPRAARRYRGRLVRRRRPLLHLQPGPPRQRRDDRRHRLHDGGHRLLRPRPPLLPRSSSSLRRSASPTTGSSSRRTSTPA